jgi:hypothetical protein
VDHRSDSANEITESDARTDGRGDGKTEVEGGLRRGSGVRLEAVDTSMESSFFRCSNFAHRVTPDKRRHSLEQPTVARKLPCKGVNGMDSSPGWGILN